MARLPTAEEVTNLYLYGTATPPADRTSEKLIRAVAFLPPPEPIDVDTYMAGPGRFATPDKFEVVRKFFNPLTDISSFQLAPGSYTKAQLFSKFGISVGWVGINQALFDDGNDTNHWHPASHPLRTLSK